MISKKAIDPSLCRNRVCFTNAARDAWKRVLCDLSDGDNILLPSYIGFTEREGSGIYDPVEQSGLRHDFYELNDDLSIDLKVIETYIKSGVYKLILIVHYFGFKVQNSEDLLRLARKYDVLVVEDCAHLFNFNHTYISKAGSDSDYTFYSLHKFFPIHTGGMLVQNNFVRNDLTVADDESLNKNFPRLLLDYDLAEIVARRKRNYDYLKSRLKNNSYLKVLKHMNDGDIPHNFPIVIKNGLREKVYFELIGRGFTLIALYYNMITPIKKNNRFHNMVKLSQDILNLPVHQDVDEDDLDPLVTQLEEVLNKLNQ